MALRFFERALRAVGKRVASRAEIGARPVVTALSVFKSATCPTCGRRSRKFHGRYWRQLAERPCFARSQRPRDRATRMSSGRTHWPRCCSNG